VTLLNQITLRDISTALGMPMFAAISQRPSKLAKSKEPKKSNPARRNSHQYAELFMPRA